MNGLLFEIHRPARGAEAERAEDAAKDKLSPRAPFNSWRAYGDAFRRELRRMGYKTARASYDEAGNCTICGEAGRCPGHHIARGE